MMTDHCLIATVSLSLSDFAVIGGMLLAMTTALLFNIKTLNRRVEAVEQHARDVNDKVEERSRELEDKKVDKKDWLRVTLSTRQKVDHLGEQLLKIESKLDADFGMSAAVNRLADGVIKAMEKG